MDREYQAKIDESKMLKKRSWWKKKNNNKDKNKQAVCDEYQSSSSLTDLNKQHPSLPSHIISEILSRLSTRDVLRFKSVCKEWYDLIQEPYFVKQHMGRWWTWICISKNKYVSGGNNSNSGNPDEEFEVIAKCFGIILERSNGNGLAKYRARNSATRQVLDLPNPRFTTSHQIAVCYNKKTKLLKLISIYFHEKKTNRQGGCEIITVGSNDRSWRKLDIPSLHDIDIEREKIMVNPIVPDCEAFHLTRIRSNLAEIVNINLEDESVFISTLPEASFSNLNNVKCFAAYPNLDYDSDSCSWKTKPGFAEIVNNELHIILLIDFKSRRYSRRITVPLKFIKQGEEEEEEEMKLNPVKFKAAYAVFVDEKQVLVYDPATWKKPVLKGIPEIDEKILSDRYGDAFNSLLTFQGMQKQC